jgi:SAM-dependent methyltransferase
MRVATSRTISRLLAARKTIRLDLGCGPNKHAPDFIGIDTRALPGVDIVHDLEEFPWPLPDDIARVVFMSHFWEHISPKKTLPFMAELHRVCRHGAQVLISGPYGVEFRYVQDPTHCNPSNDATFLYWDNRHALWEVYEPPVFHLDAFDEIPVGNFRDFNAFLTCCKRATSPKLACPQCRAQTLPARAAAAAPSARAARGRTRSGSAAALSRGR